MNQRIKALGLYLFRSLLFSLAGLLYLLLAFVFYLIFFDPRQQTPDIDYFILVIGVFGIAISFLVTLSIAGRANKAINLPLIVRLPSRIEFLSSVLIASFIYATIIQFVVAVLALIINGPQIGIQQALFIPPLWISSNILFIILAFHATDLVVVGWSRVYVFAVIGFLLYLQSGLNLLRDWLANLIGSVGTALLSSGLTSLASLAFDLSEWLSGEGAKTLENFLGLIFWPFRAIAQGTIDGYFDPAKALAPAILLIYASLLFILAAKFFSRKDLILTE